MWAQLYRKQLCGKTLKQICSSNKRSKITKPDIYEGAATVHVFLRLKRNAHRNEKPIGSRFSWLSPGALREEANTLINIPIKSSAKDEMYTQDLDWWLLLEGLESWSSSWTHSNAERLLLKFHVHQPDGVTRKVVIKPKTNGQRWRCISFKNVSLGITPGLIWFNTFD